MGPAGMPRDLVNKIFRDASVGLKSQEFRDRMNAVGTEILEMSPEVFGNFVKVESEKWGSIARLVGATGQ